MSSFLLLQTAVADTSSVGGTAFAIAFAVAALLVVFGLLFFLVSRYKRCPANRVLVISGKVGDGQAARTVSGGGAFVWPVIQEYEYLSLSPLQINIDLTDALSAENIRVRVPSVFTVAIGKTPETMQNAATRLLGLEEIQIKAQAQDIIFGQMRQVIASMKIEEINRNRDEFLRHVQESLEPELKKIGLTLLNVNVKDLTDESGYIEAIGKKAAATAVQQARGDVAEQEKLGAIRTAEAERERAVQVAQITRDREIGEQTATAERDARVAEAERTRRIAVAAAEAAATEGEAESKARVAATQSALQVREAEARRAAETARAEAEAQTAEAAARARARAALAEAERVEAERRAQTEAIAKAESAEFIIRAEASAEQVRIEAEARAAAELALLRAKAEGEADMLTRRAEAMAKLITAAGGDAEAARALLLVESVPEMVKTVADALSKIKMDKVVVWEAGGGAGAGAGGFIQNWAGLIPPIMQVVQDIGGVRPPSVLGTPLPDGDDGEVGQTGVPTGKTPVRPPRINTRTTDEDRRTR